MNHNGSTSEYPPEVDIQQVPGLFRIESNV